MTGWRQRGVMDRFKWWSWKETTGEITFSRCTLEVTSVIHAVNIYYSQSPKQGQAIANSKVKVNIYDRQPAAVHDTLARVLVLIHSHSHNVAFRHFKRLFCKIGSCSSPTTFLVESGPEEPKAERGMWVKFSRAASFTRSWRVPEERARDCITAFLWSRLAKHAIVSQVS